MSSFVAVRRPLRYGQVEPAVAPVKPRDAATMIIWRSGSLGIEVLMGRRSRRTAFVPGYFVFPGGRLDPADRTVGVASPLNPAAVARMATRNGPAIAEALAVAAVRETFEETGLMLAAKGDVGGAGEGWQSWRARGLAPALYRLGYFGRSITPTASPIRFHARFFVVAADALEGTLAGSGELTDLAFYPVSEVLAHLPLVDVTEYMLRRIVDTPAVLHESSQRTPFFAYRGQRAVVCYE